MIRWMRWAYRRRMAGFLAAVALPATLIGCSPEDSSDRDSHGRPDIELEKEMVVAGSGPEVDQLEDPGIRARIDLLTGDATESVVRAANFLADQPRFRVVADISFDVLQSDGRLLEFGSIREITIRRPDRVRMSVERRDGDVKTLYFDGSTILIDLPGHRAFVREERPGTLYAALEYLSEELGAPVPLANLFAENFAAPLENQIDAGYYVGQAEIDGRICEHLAFRLPEVDVQLWVEEGDRPLVARIVITHRHDEGNPQFRATLHGWDVALETPETIFQFAPEEGSERLTVGAMVTREPPAGKEAK